MLVEGHIPQPLLTVLPSDQFLFQKLQILTADLNIDFMLIKCRVEILVKDKAASVFLACKKLHILCLLLFFNRSKRLSPYTRCSTGCGMWPLLKKLTAE